jgi:predicted MFS family arabinose efflux permease
MAGGAGLSVAALYYSQPMLGLLGPDLQADAGAVGLVPTQTQLGYALGILFLAPLGDRYDRRRIILIKALILAVTLLMSGTAPGLGWLLAASLATGMAATMAQDIVPAAATLAPEAHRGSVVGTVMTGLLLGILLSRVVSGVVAEQFGWRVTYLAASVGMLAVAAGVWYGLPRFKPTTHLSYGGLLVSMLGLWLRHGELRRAAWAQGMLSMGFSAFWSTLAVMLHAHYGMGAAHAGAFGLAGAAGALAAPLAGRLADRRGPELVARLGAGLAAVSFAAMGLAPFLSPSGQVVLIAASAVGFDFGIQASLVAHQTIVYGIELGARSRLNALLFTGMFIGMALGAALGSAILVRWGWMGVVVFAAAAASTALLVRLVPRIGRA